MSGILEPEEIDDLDESLLEVMDREEMEDFQTDLEDSLEYLRGLEPDENREEEAWYEWEDRVQVLEDLIDAITDRIG